MAAAFQTSKNELVVFGGYAAATSSLFGDTWTWQSGCWAEVATSTGPSPRDGMALAYFPVNGTLIGYGGRTGVTVDTDSNETWIWDGYMWRPRPSSLPVLHAPLMSYDGHSGLVLYGIGGNGTSETWIWNGISWNKEPSSPPARTQAAMALDPNSNRVLLFGGLRLQDMTLVSDTWAWNGSQWSLLPTAHSPAARLGAAMTSFATKNEAVLIGGSERGTIIGDVWEWNGADWSQSAHFLPRVYGAAVDAGSEIIYFGGTDSKGEKNDVFAWDGGSWSQS